MAKGVFIIAIIAKNHFVQLWRSRVFCWFTLKTAVHYFNAERKVRRDRVMGARNGELWNSVWELEQSPIG